MNKDHEHNRDTASLLERITETVLYEGYSLYPYHDASAKNAKPVPFGAVYPEAYQKYNPDVHSASQTQCIITGPKDIEVDIRIRFLHLRSKQLLKIDPKAFGSGQLQYSETINANGKTYGGGWEAVEREINLGKSSIHQMLNNKLQTDVNFAREECSDIMYSEEGKVAGNALISQSQISGKVSATAQPVKGEKNGFRITIKIINTTEVINPENCSRDDIYGRSFLSTHAILKTDYGAFISQTDPDGRWKDAVDCSKNINTWPVLINTDDRTMLSSPIVLYDYPAIAPESMGNMFDSTEIEEALVLHLATLPEEERKKIDKGDAKMKAMLKRVESITPEELLKLHGGFKEIKSTKK